MLDGLVGADGGVAEDLALAGVVAGDLEAVLGDADDGGGDEDALGIEGEEERQRALVDLADDVLGGDAGVVEGDRELPRALDAAGRHRRERYALGAGVDEEEGEAVRARQPLRVAVVAARRAGHHEDVVGAVGGRDPLLLAREEEGVAVALRHGGDAEGVGAGVGLGDREGELAAAGGDLGEPGPLHLLRGAPHDAERIHGGERKERVRHAKSRHLFGEEDHRHDAHVGAAIGLGDHGSHEACVGDRLPELDGELAAIHRLPELTAARCKAGEELSHPVAHHELFFTEIEAE